MLEEDLSTVGRARPTNKDHRCRSCSAESPDYCNIKNEHFDVGILRSMPVFELDG